MIRQLAFAISPSSLMVIYGGGHPQPSIASFQLTLRRNIEGFEHVYIVIDALDECINRQKVLAWIEELLQWHGGKLRILLSSRPEPDIREKFNSLAQTAQFSLSGFPMNEDIKIYIDAMLVRMVRWDDTIRAHVRDVLIRGAQGMCVSGLHIFIDSLISRQVLIGRFTNLRAFKMPQSKDWMRSYQYFLKTWMRHEKMLSSSLNPHDLK